MKGSKVLAKQLMVDFGREQLEDKKALADYIGWMSDEDEVYATSIFEVGVKEVIKEYKKLRRKEKKEKVEMYSNGDHFEPLTDIEEAISLLSGVVRKAQYSERNIQHFVYEFYEQFNVPEDRRLLLKHVGVVSGGNENCDCIRWIIEGDDGALYDAYSEDVRGGEHLQKGEVVSFIPDGTTAKYIENAQHCDKDDEETVPLEYSPATIEDISELREMVLFLVVPASPTGIGKGTVFIYKEIPEGGKMRNFFVKQDGSMFMSEIY